MNLVLNGRNITGTANPVKTTYNFQGVSATEAEAIFNDMIAGRQVKKVIIAPGKYRTTLFWLDSSGKRHSITFRNFSTSGQIGEPTIDIGIGSASNPIKIELKFFP